MRDGDLVARSRVSLAQGAASLPSLCAADKRARTERDAGFENAFTVKFNSRLESP
jgi:hypothetical protein